MDAGQIEPPPNMGTAIRKDFIVGMGRSDEVFIIILDINKVFSSQELANVLDAVENEQAAIAL
ncbi:Positive regulator of CheA protein activity (CheW) [Desulfovibrio sp. TomC]|nr:Positive regulator of CheA protein activity (CheW) [Desulfovibrio sp. TomC]